MMLGKKIKGRKRHITIDTQGNLLSSEVHCASIQDRHALPAGNCEANAEKGAPNVIADTMESFPTVEHIYADGGYAGDQLNAAVLNLEASPTIEIIRRWIVERTFAWLGRCRRLAKDWEKTIQSSESWLLIAAIRRTTRYIARVMENRY